MASGKPGAVHWAAKHLRLAIDAAGVALWSWNVDDDTFVMDERAFALWGMPRGGTVTFEEMSARIHPADRDRVRAAFSSTRAILGPCETDFRILHGDVVRWVSSRGQGDDQGMVGRLMFGVFIDVTGRKQAEEANELLAGEMSHRVKNLLTIATGLTAITSRSTSTTADMARELTQRLTALGRAHDMVRPLPGTEGKAALLGDLLAILLNPYDDMGAFSGRIRISVPRMGVGEAAATTLALVVHELATNSLKYGALSVPTGTVDLSGTDLEQNLALAWTERGGPPVKPPGGPGGYGSRLLERAMTHQLDGSVSRLWDEGGVVVNLAMNKAFLVR